MIERMTQQEACGQRILENDGHAADIQTVSGLIMWLEIIAEDGDCDVERDTIADTCDAAAKRLKSMQESLIQEVERIEKLQPFFNDVSAAVQRAKSS